LGCSTETGRANLLSRLCSRADESALSLCRANMSTGYGSIVAALPSEMLDDLGAETPRIDRSTPSMRFVVPLAIPPCEFGRTRCGNSRAFARVSRRDANNQLLPASTRALWPVTIRPGPFSGLRRFHPTHGFLSFSARYHLWDFKERVALEVRLFDGRPPEYVTPYPASRTVPAKPQHAKSYFTLRFASTRFGS
jgi:hypothetical protein